MADILDDYREWAAAVPTRVSTHSDRCHMWHAECMIHRLARRLEEATLTDAERSAIADAADRYAEMTPESSETAATLRGLLERLG